MLVTKASQQDLVVLLDKVETSVAGNESGDLLGVLDQLNTNGLTNGRVRLLGFDSATED